jgi:hypothetical protein
LIKKNENIVKGAEQWGQVNREGKERKVTIFDTS